MANISIKLDLLKFIGKETTMQGKNGKPVQGIFLPYEANHIYVGTKGRYLDLTAVELKQQREGSKDTHFIKPDLKKEVRDQMTEKERNDIPIVGNAIYWGNSSATPAPAPAKPIYSPELPPPDDFDSELPF
jgi:hypothetical protein